MKKPILLITFNRPETTRLVLEEIRKYRPEELYIAADGPRAGVEHDAERCRAVRELAGNVDWKCRVHTLFQEQNLGCQAAPVKAISWFFETEEEGIILEDDCVPTQDFFRFAEQMLTIYREDSRIMHIAGMNFQDGIRRGCGDYFFTHQPFCWGWATWRRAWKEFQLDMPDFPEYRKENKIAEIFPRERYPRWRYMRLFQKCYEKSPYFKDVWDFQWTYAIFRKKGLCIVPNYSLVSNIGMEGTHFIPAELCGTEVRPMPEKIVFPPEIAVDPEADGYFFRKVNKGDWKDLVRYILSLITLRDWM